jgi:hypothetical protein
MKILAFVFLAIFLMPSQTLASGPDLIGLSYKRGRPIASDQLENSVINMASTDLAISHNLAVLRRVRELNYQITGYTDGIECLPSTCKELALRRAQAFRLALIRAGAPSTRICAPKAKITPWPPTYKPTPDELAFGRQANVEPVVGGCA